MKILLALLDYLQQSNLWINMHFLSTIAFILLLLFFFFLIVRHQKPTQKSPPSPPRLPIIGNLHQLGSLPHRSLQALSNKYGSIMLLRIGCVPTIIVSSEEMAREVMKKNDLRVASRPKSSMAKMLMYDCDVAFAPYGEYWRQVRKISVTHLLSIKMVQSFCSIREEEVSTMIDKICASQHGLVDLSELFVSLTSDIICRVALGRKYCEGVGAKKVRGMLGEFGNLLGSFPIGDFIPWLGWMDHLSGLNSRARKNSKELDSFLEEVLEEHLRAKRDANGKCKEGGDFVDILLSLDERDERFGVSLEKDEKVGVSLSLGRDSIKAIILDMFAAGTDTTYTTLLWTMAELMRNPKVMKKAQVEVRSVIGHNQKHISGKEIDRMPYLKAIIKESLRLNTPVPLLVPRETTQDIELLSFHIPKGTRVIVNAWAIARDPRSWENPADFMPERFLDSDVDFRGQDFRFIPFGAGRRSCPGAGFAIPTVELALASLLRHFDWEMPEGMEAEVLDMTESPGIALYKKTGLVLVAKPCIV